MVVACVRVVMIQTVFWCFPYFCVGWLLVRCWVSGMAHCVVPVYRFAACHVGTACGGGLFCGVWVLCENWIVDASILFFCKFDFLDSFSVF